MGQTYFMSEKITVIDYSKIGTKGYPHNWQELGLQPPTKIVEKSTRQIPTNIEATPES
jgi:hypothetical protein